MRWRVYQCVGEGRGEGTIKGIVGIIHCRLIQLTADRISESELTDGIPKYISKLLKTDKIHRRGQETFMEQAVLQLKRRRVWPYSVTGGVSMEAADL